MINAKQSAFAGASTNRNSTCRTFAESANALSATADSSICKCLHGYICKCSKWFSASVYQPLLRPLRRSFLPNWGQLFLMKQSHINILKLKSWLI